MTTINILKPTEHTIKTLSPNGELIDVSSDADSLSQIIINDASCQIMSVNMPVKQTRQIIKALPFALEEQIANDIDDNHIHFLGKIANEAFAMIVDRNVIESVIEQYNPDELLYLPLLLPVKSSAISICILDGVASVRCNQFNAMSIQADILALVLERIKTDTLTDIEIYDFDKNNELISIELENLGFQVNVKPVESLIEHIKANTNTSSFNLIAGPYQKKKTKTETKLGKFKVPAGLAAALLIVIFAANLKEMKQYDQMADLVKSASKNFYTQLFPDERVRSIKRQFSDKIEEADGGVVASNGFINLLGNTANEIKSLGIVEWDAIRFTRKKNELELNLIVNNIAQLDQIKTQLTKNGLQVDIASATETGSKIKGVLKVKQNG